jgi:hypothetical protein
VEEVTDISEKHVASMFRVSKPSKLSLLPALCWFLACHIPPKCQLALSELLGIILQKIELFIITPQILNKMVGFGLLLV